jgi:hypothetical protein
MKLQLEALLGAIKRFEQQYQRSTNQEQYANKVQQYHQLKKLIEQYLSNSGKDAVDADKAKLQELATAFFEAVRAAKATNPGLKMT